MQARIFGNGVLLVSISCCALAGAALVSAKAFSDENLDEFINVDTKEGGKVSLLPSSATDFAFVISDQSRSRAELRRKGQQSDMETMGGTFTIVRADPTADKISIIQALTVNKPNSETGRSTPSAQLIIKRSGDVWKFYVNQDQSSSCTDHSITIGERVEISMSYTQGDRPSFTITKDGDAQTCKKTGGKTLPLGGNNRFYYGKLGAYLTTSGAGAAIVTWTSVFD